MNIMSCTDDENIRDHTTRIVSVIHTHRTDLHQRSKCFYLVLDSADQANPKDP